MLMIITILVDALQGFSNAEPIEITIGRANTSLEMKRRVAGRLGIERIAFNLNWFDDQIDDWKWLPCDEYHIIGDVWENHRTGSHWRTLKAGRRVANRYKAAR